MYINIAILLIMLMICIITDLKYGKIKNKIVVTCSIIGFLVNLISFDFHIIIQSITGIILPIIIFYIFFSMKMLGAGDIKLFSAIGAIMGLNFCIKVIVLSFLYASIVAVILIILNNSFLEKIQNIITYFYYIITSRYITPFTNTINNDNTKKIHLSIEIALGVISVIFLSFR